LSFRASRREPDIKQVRIKVPQKFDPISLEVVIEHAVGFMSGGREEAHRERLTIRQVIAATLDVSITPQVKQHLDEIVKIHGRIIVVPNIAEEVAITPIVGDISTTPKMAMNFPTTMNLPIQFICDERILRDLRTNADSAIRLLERVEEDQSSLRFFIEQYKRFLEEHGAKVEGPIEDVHFKVGPVPVQMYYASQVSPQEDNAVIGKIENLVNKAREENALVTLLVKQIDDTLIDLATRHKFTVVNVFNGTELRGGTWQGDLMLKGFIKEELGLEIIDYGENPRGSYSQTRFKEVLDQLGPMGSTQGA